MDKNDQSFNLIIVGIGGQGLITLLKIISEAAFLEGFDIKTSELHGLSQRGGSVEVHGKFGKRIYSPLVKAGGADLVVALELQEALNATYYAAKEKTVFLMNDFSSHLLKGKLIEKEKVLSELAIFAKKKLLVLASEFCKKEIGSEVLAGVFLLSFAVFNKLIPLKPDSINKAIGKVVSERYLDINKKAFQLAKTYKN